MANHADWASKDFYQVLGVPKDADQATVLIVSGWTMNNSQPVVQTFRWKVTVSRIDGQMKLTGYEWVT